MFPAEWTLITSRLYVFHHQVQFSIGSVRNGLSETNDIPIMLSFTLCSVACYLINIRTLTLLSCHTDVSICSKHHCVWVQPHISNCTAVDSCVSIKPNWIMLVWKSAPFANAHAHTHIWKKWGTLCKANKAECNLLQTNCVYKHPWAHVCNVLYVTTRSQSGESLSILAREQKTPQLHCMHVQSVSAPPRQQSWKVSVSVLPLVQLLCVSIRSQLQQSGALRRYTRLVFAGAQRINSAQSRLSRTGSQTQIQHWNIRLFFRIKHSVLRPDHISLYLISKCQNVFSEAVIACDSVINWWTGDAVLWEDNRARSKAAVGSFCNTNATSEIPRRAFRQR